MNTLIDLCSFKDKKPSEIARQLGFKYLRHVTSNHSAQQILKENRILSSKQLDIELQKKGINGPCFVGINDWCLSPLDTLFLELTYDGIYKATNENLSTTLYFKLELLDDYNIHPYHISNVHLYGSYAKSKNINETSCVPRDIEHFITVLKNIYDKKKYNEVVFKDCLPIASYYSHSESL